MQEMIHAHGGSEATSEMFPSAFRPSLETPSSGSENGDQGARAKAGFPIPGSADASYDDQLSKTASQEEFSELRSPNGQLPLQERANEKEKVISNGVIKKRPSVKPAPPPTSQNSSRSN